MYNSTKQNALIVYEILLLQRMKRFLLIIIILLYAQLQLAFSQTSNATLFGIVSDEKGNPLEMVNVSIKNYPIATITNRKGEYLLRIPSGREVIVVFSSIGYQFVELPLNLKSEESVERDVTIQSKNEELNEVVVTDRAPSSGNIVRINPRVANALPEVGMGSVEGIIKTMPGVSSSNELSNQYSVRGGNFDENLVYVNDIEVYRPTLIRAGQQEGMSFINSDMVSSIEFSAGGFDAKYGDKMSSVLDIKYNKPSESSSAFAASMLGGKVHVENISKNGKFTYNMGARYKTFRYLLASLDEKGEYNPSFLDFQGFFTYNLTKKLELGFLGTASSNRYEFAPESLKTSTGTFNDQKSLDVAYEGQEIDRYRTLTSSLYLQYKPTENLYLKFIGSAYTTHEQETYDIIGYYLLNEVQKEGSEEQDDSTMNIGVGYYHEHGRNYFDANVISFDHRGGLKGENNFLQWGLTYKREFVHDKMSEWEFRDSAGYSLPYSDEYVKLYYSGKTDHQFDEQRFEGFIQNSYSVPVAIGTLSFTGGLRTQYWTFSDHLTVSPRFSASLNTGIEHDIVARLSFGWYHQPAFYREIKDYHGNINYNIQTPRSIQAVGGFDYSFTGWDRPFRFTAETYYKAMQNLIPYQIDNVRVRYLSNKISDGFAYGLDLKVNGEFVSGTQSWVSLSLMNTMEDIAGDTIGYIPRPTDQRFKFSMYFQDYLPGLPAYQMHLAGHFITGTPYGRPTTDGYQQLSRMRPYRRIDIGFTRSLVSNGENFTKSKFFDKFKEASITLEVFNVIDIENESSYSFITDYKGTTYSIPNHLTGQTFNLKLSCGF